MLYGRATEKAAIDALAAGARRGAGGALVLRGEAGIGKTALLAHAREQAAGMRVLHTAGVEPEQELGHAALQRLLQTVRGRIAALPAAQADALDSAFGRSSVPVTDRFLVSLATLTLLSDAARDEPLLCLVDDAHWVDRRSLDALAFTARRLATEPVALLLAVRSDALPNGQLTGLAELPLAGLDSTSARALLRERGIAAADEELLLRAAAGNPLALRELPAGVPPGAATGEPLPLAGRLQQAFVARLRGHGTAARQLLLLAAADGTGRTHVLRHAAAAHPDRPPAGDADLDRLGALLVTDGPDVAFRHPLVRSAVYFDSSPADRKAAHLALAAALRSEPAERDRRAWHLGQAADGPDDTVAADLDVAAERAMQRAGPAAAAATFVRAAQLSPPGSDRTRRLVAAATASWHSGDTVRTAQLLELAERDDDGTPLVRAATAMLRARLELRTGNPADALRLLRPVTAYALGADPTTAVELLMLLGDAGYHAGEAGTWRQISDSLERLQLTGGDPDSALLRLARAVARVRRGQPNGLTEGDLAVVEQSADPVRLCWAGGMMLGLGDAARGGWLRRRAMDRARATGATGTLAWILEYVVADEMAAGRFRVAQAYAEEGVHHATQTGQPNLDSWFRGTLAVLAAMQGREADARDLADQVLSHTVGRPLVAETMQASRSLGLAALAAGRAEQAIGHLRPADIDGDPHPGLALQNVPDLVEAATRLGRPDLAAEPLRRFDQWAEATGARQLLALSARCRALTGRDDVDEAFRRALMLHSSIDQPLELARTQLLYAEHLRRDRRRAEACLQLRSALTTFERLGAARWAQRARSELRAAGGTTTEPSPDVLASLTAQELRIATAAARGATNREIAAQLFLSPRTVDYHLRKVFRKTGVTSRIELTRLLLRAHPDPSERRRD